MLFLLSVGVLGFEPSLRAPKARVLAVDTILRYVTRILSHLGILENP